MCTVSLLSPKCLKFPHCGTIKHSTKNRDKRPGEPRIVFLLFSHLARRGSGRGQAFALAHLEPRVPLTLASRPNLHAAVRGFSRKHLTWSTVRCSSGGCSGHKKNLFSLRLKKKKKRENFVSGMMQSCLNLTLAMTGTYGNLEVCGSNYNTDRWLDEQAPVGS